MVPTDKMPGIEINIACIILFIEGTIESNRRVLKILKALKTEKGPEAGIKDTTTIIKSKTFQPSLKNFNLYTKIFIISSIVKIVNAILSTIDKNTPYSNLISALVSSPRVIALIIITRVEEGIATVVSLSDENQIAYMKYQEEGSALMTLTINLLATNNIPTSIEYKITIAE